ncbi:hypothetical protein RN001_002034 [Aquatica leii]|uniref:Gag protein n=1 Tax=Aquatica leii TaxID=1421715 RepID=A0AAN7SR37_9COLE|nr:hypothetical protein RN001_002034 [Aquatica leii]
MNSDSSSSNDELFLEIPNDTQSNKKPTFRKFKLAPSKMNNLNSNVVNKPTQPIHVPDKNKIQLLMQAIPEYFPGNNLSIFIKEVDNLLNHLRDRLTPDLQYVVFFSIRSKIKEDARDYIAYANATQWTEIRTSLLRKYGDQRSEELLEANLRQCVQNRNENYSDFYTRVLKAFNDLIQIISLNANDPNLLIYKKFTYNQLALKTFQIGLLEPYRSYLSNFQLNTIEECLNKCYFYDNRKQEWEYCEFIRRSHNNSNNNNKPIRHNSPLQNPSRTFPPQTSYQSSFNKPIQARPFQRPINKPIQQNSRYFTNRQVFGPDSRPNTKTNTDHINMPRRSITVDELIHNLVDYFNQEKQNNGPLIPLTAVHARVSDALKIDTKTISNALRRHQNQDENKENEPQRKV